MKTLIPLFLTLSLAVSFGQTAKKNSKKTTAPATRMEVKTEIPKGATLGDDGSYHYTDSKGTKWLYRQTPFGIAKSEEKAPVPQSPVTPAKELTKATIVGDTVKFERPNAFGLSKWEKKTSDLTDEEKKIVENQKAKQQ